MIRFLKRICGYKNKSSDAARETFTHLKDFFNVARGHRITIDDFCGKFIRDADLLTIQEADRVLTLMLESCKDYKRKKSADPERNKELSKILGHVHHKANLKKVGFRCECSSSLLDRVLHNGLGIQFTL